MDLSSALIRPLIDKDEIAAQKDAILAQVKLSLVE